MQMELEESVLHEQQERFMVLLTVDHQDIHYAMVQIEYPNHVHLVFEIGVLHQDYKDVAFIAERCFDRLKDEVTRFLSFGFASCCLVMSSIPLLVVFELKVRKSTYLAPRCESETNSSVRVLSLSSSSYFLAMSKNDMKDRICALSKNDLKDLVKTYRIPLDLHRRLPGFIVYRLPADTIGIYFEFLWFYGVHVPFLTFLLSVLKYFKVHISQLVPLGDWFSFSERRNTEDICMDDGPSSLKKWKNKFFLINRRAILYHLKWRHSCSCVSDDLPSDGYDRNDVQRSCACLIRLREMREEVLVCSRLSSMWCNKECDPVFRRVDDNVGRLRGYNFHSLFIVSFVIIPSSFFAAAGACFVAYYCTGNERCCYSVPTLDEIVASLPDSRLAKKSKGSSYASWPLKKRKLQKRDLEASFSAPELDQAKGTDEADLVDLCAQIEDILERDEGVSMRSISAPTSRLGKRLGDHPSIAVVSAFEPSYVRTLVPASTSSRSLSLGGIFASGCVGKSEAEVMRRQMDPLDCLACSALARDAEYDQIPDDDFGIATRGEEIDLTLKALDRTITLAALRRTKSLFPLGLSNRVNVLSALLVSHGYELNSRYANLVSSKGHLQEKLDKKKRDVKLLCLEITSLDNELENLQRGYDALGQENKELRSQRDAAFEEVKKLWSQLIDATTTSASLSEELTQTDAKLSEQALTADFDKTLVGFPTTLFPFLSKIAAASEGTLSDVAQIFLDKFVRLATSVFVTPSSVNEALEQVPP
uniref:Transposase (Putative), gypsy type n=1 Tax=Tanacetum cinerariifolium TaxID=118510 RepID=A0A699GKL3_TANCI|nr:hypothetical protein [Tanacetum cinerariifolium]